jgi:hypothetical protein
MVPPVSRLAARGSLLHERVVLTPARVNLYQVINRVRGKTKVQRVRDRVRSSKANKRALGKVPLKHKVSEDTPMTRRDGGKKLGAMSKKSIRKREKRAKNVRRTPFELPSSAGLTHCNPLDLPRSWPRERPTPWRSKHRCISTARVRCARPATGRPAMINRR